MGDCANFISASNPEADCVQVSTTPIFQVTWLTITDCSGPGPFDFLRHHLFGTFIPTIVSNPHLKLPIFTAPRPDSIPQRNFTWKTCNHLLLNTQQTLAT